MAEQPTPSTNCPTDFPVECNVIVTSTHSKHANKGGTVRQHTKKYVMFAPDKHPSNIIRILPKSLAAYHPDGRHMINSSDDNKEQNPGQMERTHKMYNRLDETHSFLVADSFVSFMQTFQYLSLLISYNLRDGNDITARLAQQSLRTLQDCDSVMHLEVLSG
jgi:hypothetical protein